MAWIQRFCFCFPIRLGVIATTASSMVTAFFAVLFYFVYEPDISGIIRQLYKDEEETHDRSFFVAFILNLIIMYPETFGLATIASIGVYMFTCIVAIAGAVKLFKWFLLPYIIVDFVRLTVFFIGHILLMLSLKEKYDLGVLILASVAGGFVVLFLGYFWATVVAFYQIVGVIQTEEYKKLYGHKDRFGLRNRIDTSSIPKMDLIWVTKNGNESLQGAATNSQQNKPIQFWYVNELPYKKKTRLITFD